MIALLRLTSVASGDYATDRVLTSFVHGPMLAVVVAVPAGVVGMLSLTEARNGALIGVLVSVTTVPAIGNIGAAAAYGELHDVGGAAIQLVVNLTSLVVAGSITLAVQAHQTTRKLKLTAHR